MGSTAEPTGPPPAWFGRAWSRFRGLPVAGQVLVWAAAWPVLAALYLLSAARPSAGRVGGAAALLLLVTPVWAGAITSLGGESEPGAAPEVVAEPEPEPEAPSPDTTPSSVGGDLEVHYLDVGQGDATLLLHDEVAVLVDAGRWQSSGLVPMLRARGVEALDLVVITHPHADHIGQFDQVMDAFPVDEVWWSGSVTTSQTFERAVAALERSDAAYEEPRVGDQATLGPLDIEVVNPPAGVGLSDLHDAGVSLRVTYGEVRLLFTGDNEAATERRMTSDSAAMIDADILQLGHHGSSTSTTASFLSAVDPMLAIYSAGANNSYGHPAPEVVDRVLASDIELYGTDVHGTILVTTDGAGWSVATEASGQVEAAPSNPPSNSSPETSTAGGACTGDQVDINAADRDQLQRIDQIGPARLEDIITRGVACVG